MVRLMVWFVWHTVIKYSKLVLFIFLLFQRVCKGERKNHPTFILQIDLYRKHLSWKKLVLYFPDNPPFNHNTIFDRNSQRKMKTFCIKLYNSFLIVANFYQSLENFVFILTRIFINVPILYPVKTSENLCF